MITIDYSGIKNLKISTEIKNKIQKIKKQPLPAFLTDKPPIKQMLSLAKKYSKYKNIVLIGNGGSINPLFALYNALETPKKNLYIIHTMEPDYIKKIKSKAKKSDTLVVSISKSGSNVQQIEATLAFLGYKMLFVTSPNKGVLYHIAKRKNIPIMDHPEVGGRYSGRTACALMPAALLGLDIEKINTGAKSMYKKCSYKTAITKNPALKISSILYQSHGTFSVLIFAALSFFTISSAYADALSSDFLLCTSK